MSKSRPNGEITLSYLAKSSSQTDLFILEVEIEHP